MEADERTLSEVHIELESSHPTINSILFKYPVFITRFYFTKKHDSQKITPHCPLLTNKSDELQFDEDGDMILERRQQVKKEVIFIEHTCSTHLQDVGLQVWLGCLYLCDYIMHNSQEFKGSKVVEFGAGVGLASIVSSIFASRVLCTDVGVGLLELCHRNVASNKDLICDQNDGFNDCSSIVHVRELDWNQTELRKDEQPFSWSSEDENSLYAANIYLAADVIYSDDLTAAFFRTVHRIMSRNVASKKLLISVEKRLNFTLDHLDVACPAYKYFRKCMEELCRTNNANGIRFTASLVSDFNQHFQYNRSKYLELWCVQANVD